MAGNWGESAIRAFSTVSDVLNKRELLARDEADRKIKEEERVKNQPLVDATRVETLNKIRRDAALGLREDNATLAIDALRLGSEGKGAEMTQPQQDIAFKVANMAPQFMKAKTPEELNDRISTAEGAAAEWESVKQQLFRSGMSPEGGYLRRDQAPQLFNFLEKMPQFDPNIGTGDTGEATKAYAGVYITPEGLVPHLEVTRGNDGTKYFAPMTFGHDADPNAPVLKIPPGLIDQTMQSNKNAALTLKELQRVYGDTEAFKRYMAAQKPGLESRLYSDTLSATATYLEKNPSATANQIHAFIGKTAGENAEKLGIDMSIEHIKKIADMFQREVAVHTGAKIMYDGKGTPISVANTPEAINEAISKGFNEVKAEEKLPESIRTVKAYKDLTPTEKAVFDKLHPGPKAAGGEKPPTKAEVQRGEVEFGKQLVPALAEFYPDLLGSKNIGDFSTKLTPAHKKAIDTGRKMLKEGSTPGEAADAVVALLGTPPVPKEELGWWDTATGAIKRVLSPKPAEQKPEEPGMIKKGNIDYSTRPNVNNPDGTHSSVVSKSFNFDGEEVLIPTISDDGKKLSDKEAINLYKKTGKHLGKFKTAKDADNYANAHHAEMGPKTAKLPDGKFYKDGDIYTDPKTKQKSIVRVK